MSEAAEGVQSESSDQGADEGGEGTYVDYLQNVPEDYRPHVEPFAKQIQQNAEEKFREYADYRKQWEPYEEAGLNEYDPEGLQQLIEFAETMQDENEFKQWWIETGQKAGFYNEIAEALGIEDDSDWDDDDFETDNAVEGLDVNTIRDVFSELLDERLGPLEQERQQEAQNRQIEEANNNIESQIGDLHERFGDFDEQAVYRFAYSHADTSENPIEDGFRDYQKFVADIENGVVSEKSNAPRPPETGEGPANTQAQAPNSMEEAKQMAKERLAQLH